MTGYGKSVAELPAKKITIELRSLNSKQLDINTRMPWIYKEKEIEMRNIISRELERGKVDLSISVDTNGESVAPTINSAVVKSYHRQLTAVAGELYIDKPDQLLSVIMRLPETLSTEKEELTEEEWKKVESLLMEATGDLNSYRQEEGSALATDMLARVENILSLLAEIEPHESSRIESIKERLKTGLKNSGIEEPDMNRFEQELVYYLEKLDINEEKVRLKKNCDYFIETLQGEASSGKKMGFIAQEIGREINTIGSKSNNAPIQKIVVRMKDELEKIKEQVLNIL